MANDNPVAEQLRARVASRFEQVTGDLQKRLEALQREVADLRAARGSVHFEVDGVGAAYLNLADGRMLVEDVPLDAPFMAVVLSEPDWRRFADGTVSSGLLGGPAGERPLGQSRIQRVRAIKGVVRFVLTGLADGDWTVTTYFGEVARPSSPQTTITVAADVAEKLQRGELNPQMAFMQGQVRMEGDAGLAMQIGMALMM